ncbi:hypothetical protein CYMTET_36431 [Cymbomonas tetramitiformis]|uniref:Uncharacterized protein n=1 Tax=Cymbomonas tetramitiformis TaxID=36881 RepID=A0AAE0CFZ5_9CHLO|nr:hypothetical protein CYMTET_36431 [Cymbomonas tetramitiformis]
MATIQAELAVQEENIETQRTWLPAAHGTLTQVNADSSGAVYFSGLQLQSSGPIGNISVSANYGDIVAPFTVELTDCLIGMMYSDGFCYPCQEGTVTFDNSSKCIECDPDKMLCSSWNKADVPNNHATPTPNVQEISYWLAPAIQNVGRDTARFPDLVYQCVRKEACPAYNLSGSGVTTATTAQRCAEGNRQDVPLCDGCEIGRVPSSPSCKCRKAASGGHCDEPARGCRGKAASGAHCGDPARGCRGKAASGAHCDAQARGCPARLPAEHTVV